METQPTVQQMNNLAVCVSSVYRANPSVSRHLSIRACLVIVHPCLTHTHTQTHADEHPQAHTFSIHTHTRSHTYMMCRLAHIQFLELSAGPLDSSFTVKLNLGSRSEKVS